MSSMACHSCSTGNLLMYVGDYEDPRGFGTAKSVEYYQCDSCGDVLLPSYTVKQFEQFLERLRQRLDNLIF